MTAEEIKRAVTEALDETLDTSIISRKEHLEDHLRLKGIFRSIDVMWNKGLSTLTVLIFFIFVVAGSLYFGKWIWK